jgi:hypothetical protein
MNAIARATLLAKRLGIDTKAKTLTGLLKALRTGKRHARAPKVYGTQVFSGRLYPKDLLAGFAQTRARTRTIHRHKPLHVAVWSAFGWNCTDSISHVPNSYRGRAEESYAAARRIGQAVVVTWGRTECQHSSYGNGSTTISAVPGYHRAIRAADVRAMLPTLPAGYRWDADENGPRILRMADGADLHLDPSGLADLVTGASPVSSAIGLLDANATKRAETARLASITESDLAKVMVCRADSLRTGNCVPGTDSFIRAHALDSHRHYSGAVLLRIAPTDPRVRLTLRTAAAREHREAEAGVCMLADHA